VRAGRERVLQEATEEVIGRERVRSRRPGLRVYIIEAQFRRAVRVDPFESGSAGASQCGRSDPGPIEVLPEITESAEETFCLSLALCFLCGLRLNPTPWDRAHQIDKPIPVYRCSPRAAWPHAKSILSPKPGLMKRGGGIRRPLNSVARRPRISSTARTDTPGQEALNRHSALQRR